jgi:CDP-diacylglycerol pyrophosphatase
MAISNRSLTTAIALFVVFPPPCANADPNALRRIVHEACVPHVEGAREPSLARVST